MKSEIRTFIAIELEDNVRQRLKEIQEQLQLLGPDVKWIEPENIHITLRFSGNLSPRKLKTLMTALPGFIKGIPPFLISVSGLGAFPNPQKPEVLWAAVTENGELSHLAEEIESGVASCGLGKGDKEFSPHITIGRIKSLTKITRLTEAIPAYAISPALEQTISKVTLFKSTLTSQGPIYEVLQRVELR